MNPALAVIAGMATVMAGFLLWGITLAAGDIIGYWNVDMSVGRYEVASFKQIACGIGYVICAIVVVLTALYVVGFVVVSVGGVLF